MTTISKEETAGVVGLTASDVQGPGVVFCPNPKMPLWSAHPRVFIGVSADGYAKCPYCSTIYHVEPGKH